MSFLTLIFIYVTSILTCDSFLTDKNMKNCTQTCKHAENPFNYSMVYTREGEDIKSTFVYQNYKFNLPVPELLLQKIVNICPRIVFKLGKLCLMNNDKEVVCTGLGGYLQLLAGTFLLIGMVFVFSCCFRMIYRIICCKICSKN